MTDPLDGTIRDGLREVGDSYEPPAPPVAEVTQRTRAARARRTGVLVGSAAAVLALLALTIVAVADDDDAAQVATEGDEGPDGLPASPSRDDEPNEAPAPGRTDQGGGGGAPGSSDGSTGDTIPGSGGTAEVEPAPDGSTSTSAAPEPVTGDVVLTAEDSGRTISVPTGTRIEIRLSPDDGTWTEPVTSDGAIVERESSGQAPDGSSSGVFRAASSGAAQLTAEATPACATAQPRCLRPNQQFQVTVEVR